MALSKLADAERSEEEELKKQWRIKSVSATGLEMRSEDELNHFEEYVAWHPWTSSIDAMTYEEAITSGQPISPQLIPVSEFEAEPCRWLLEEYFDDLEAASPGFQDAVALLLKGEAKQELWAVRAHKLRHGTRFQGSNEDEKIKRLLNLAEEISELAEIKRR